MKKEEFCINCGSYHPELDGWCDVKEQLTSWNDTCGKFKAAEK